MALVALPTCPLPNRTEPFLLDFGGVQTPFMGGPAQRVNRIGTRLGCRYTMPEMDDEEAGMFVSRLLRGKQGEVLVPWPVPLLAPGPTPVTPLVFTSANGTAIQLGGLFPGQVLREGLPLSVNAEGRRYMHLTTGKVVANGTGIASVGIFPPTRTTYPANSQVEIAMPLLQGMVSPGDELSWSTALELDTAISFSVVESR